MVGFLPANGKAPPLQLKEANYMFTGLSALLAGQPTFRK